VGRRLERSLTISDRPGRRRCHLVRDRRAGASGCACADRRRGPPGG
jgi:hypothetical protein